MHNFRDYSVLLKMSDGSGRYWKLPEISNDANQDIHEWLIDFCRFAITEMYVHNHEWTQIEWQYRGSKSYTNTGKMTLEELAQFYRNLQE